MLFFLSTTCLWCCGWIKMIMTLSYCSHWHCSLCSLPGRGLNVVLFSFHTVVLFETSLCTKTIFLSHWFETGIPVRIKRLCSSSRTFFLRWTATCPTASFIWSMRNYLTFQTYCSFFNYFTIILSSGSFRHFNSVRSTLLAFVPATLFSTPNGTLSL